MAADLDLGKIAQSMKDLESRFVESRQLDLHLRAGDEAEFRRLAVEAKSILDGELERLNDFSTTSSTQLTPVQGASSEAHPSLGNV